LKQSLAHLAAAVGSARKNYVCEYQADLKKVFGRLVKAVLPDSIKGVLHDCCEQDVRRPAPGGGPVSIGDLVGVLCVAGGRIHQQVSRVAARSIGGKIRASPLIESSGQLPQAQGVTPRPRRVPGRAHCSPIGFTERPHEIQTLIRFRE
jgi:hypothetical protein